MRPQDLARFFQNGSPVDEIIFPMTEIGKSTTVGLTIENNFENEVELIFWSNDNDLTIQEGFDKRLRPAQSTNIKLIFSPKEDRFNSVTPALNTDWGFREIVHP
jgi:hypothetical protein